jgi:hypothetical protein
MQTFLISKNKVLIDKFVSSYFELTKQSVRNTLSLAKILKTVKDKYEYSEIDEEDFKYFCKQIQVNDESSQFRKYLCIAKSADKIEEHLDKFPTAMSVVYKIITLPPDDFDELIQTNLLSPDLTLKKLNHFFPTTKQLKNNSHQQITIDANNLSINVNYNNSSLKFDDEKIVQSLISSVEKIMNDVSFDEVSIFMNNDFRYSMKRPVLKSL